MRPWRAALGGAALTGYSTTLTALTITNASASGNKYNFICLQ